MNVQGFFMSFESFCINCILKSTNRSKYVYFLLVYKQFLHGPLYSLIELLEREARLTAITIRLVSDRKLKRVQLKHCVWAKTDRQKVTYVRKKNTWNQNGRLQSSRCSTNSFPAPHLACKMYAFLVLPCQKTLLKTIEHFWTKTILSKGCRIENV